MPGQVLQVEEKVIDLPRDVPCFSYNVGDVTSSRRHLVMVNEAEGQKMIRPHREPIRIETSVSSRQALPEKRVSKPPILKSSSRRNDMLQPLAEKAVSAVW